MTVRGTPISRGAEWDFGLLETYDREIAVIAADHRLDTYPNQIEIITSEQMIDNYASAGLPVGFPHWSYGKEFARNEHAYRTGKQGLAYEIVINSNPCISYLMEENTVATQALVIAHACYGHNSFFKGNHLFRTWTDAEAILDYLVFAKDYVMKCEERYGYEAVEEIIDSCNALATHGVNRFLRKTKHHTFAEENKRNAERFSQKEKDYDDLFARTMPQRKDEEIQQEQTKRSIVRIPAEPHENLLYIVHKYSPKLAVWQKELVRIVMKLQQYFYPQSQTKVMNEGWATFWHYTIVNRLYEKGLVDDGFMIEFLKQHTNVTAQPSFDSGWYSGLNPYAIGFAMFQDIRRICESPTKEDREWFPDIAGGDWIKVLDFAMRNFKDESFFLQYLSPNLMREFHLFAIADHEGESDLIVDSIHNEDGYRRVRKLLAAQNAWESRVPDLQVNEIRAATDRGVVVDFTKRNGRPLHEQSAVSLKHFARLWGYNVDLRTIGEDGKVESTDVIKPSKFEFEKDDKH